MQSNMIGDATKLPLWKAMILAHLRLAGGAIKEKHRHVAVANHVHMRRTVIVGIDREPQRAEFEHRRHTIT